MSYILDALEKSEKKRKGRTVPDLQTVHEPIPKEKDRRSVWLYIIAGIVTVNVMVVVWWLKPWEKPSADITQQQPVQQLNSLNEHIERERNVPAQTAIYEARPSKSEPAIKPQRSTAGSSFTDPQPMHKVESVSEKASVEPSPPQQALLPETPTLHREQPEDISPEILQPTQDEIPVSVDKENQAFAELLEQKKTEQAVAPPAESASLITEKDTPDQIPLVHQLPESVRNKLPDLKISYLAYAHNPSARLASINGRIVRQGQIISNDVRLEEIIESGVILTYKEYRFRMKVF